MKLESYRSAYYDLSGKASDVARQLALAGIALIWIFKLDNAGPLAIPVPLLLPAALFVVTLALDLLQYVFGALIWGAFNRYHESKGKKDDEDVLAPSYFNWPALFCFWLKLCTVLIGYMTVFKYVFSLHILP